MHNTNLLDQLQFNPIWFDDYFWHQKIAQNHIQSTPGSPTNKSVNRLSSNCDISAVFAPILLQKPLFESSFAPVFLTCNIFDQWFPYYTKYSSMQASFLCIIVDVYEPKVRPLNQRLLPTFVTTKCTMHQNSPTLMSAISGHDILQIVDY